MSDPSFTELAQARDRTSVDSRPYYRLRIGGDDFTPDIQSFTVTYAMDGGTSEMTIPNHREFGDRENQGVVLDLGYGRHHMEYFRGKLADPNDNQWGEANEATAWGPFKWMAEARFGKQTSYLGLQARAALIDMARRSGFADRYISVVGGTEILTNEVTFVLEQQIGEAAAQICEKLNFAFSDVFGGGRIFLPKPRPTASGPERAVYSEDHYPVGGFTAVPQPRARYAEVWVFRRLADGTEDFETVKVRIPRRGRAPAAPGSAYEIPDFVGSYDDAVRVASETARSISEGTFDCSLTGIAANMDIRPYDTLRTLATEFRDEGGRYRERYKCTYRWLNDREMSIEGSASGGLTQSAGGAGLLIAERKLPMPFYMNQIAAGGHSYVVSG